MSWNDRDNTLGRNAGNWDYGWVILTGDKPEIMLANEGWRYSSGQDLYILRHEKVTDFKGQILRKWWFWRFDTPKNCNNIEDTLKKKKPGS